LKKEKDLHFKVRRETPLRIKEGRNYFLKQILQFLWFLSFPNLEPFTEISEVFIIYKYISTNHKEAFTFFLFMPRELFFLPTLHGGRRAPKDPNLMVLRGKDQDGVFIASLNAMYRRRYRSLSTNRKEYPCRLRLS
jgi:hypothetical protein